MSQYFKDSLNNLVVQKWAIIIWMPLRQIPDLVDLVTETEVHIGGHTGQSVNCHPYLHL